MKAFYIGFFTISFVFGTLVANTLYYWQNLSNATVSFEYGEPGPYTMVEETFKNPEWRTGEKVSVFFPAELTEPVPVLFFLHGFGCTNWKGYKTLITHLVSKGFAVVYTPYPSIGITTRVSERYDILWDGFIEATDRYATRFDLKRVGFLGHSFGAGAIPAIAWKGLVEEGWGRQGAFLFLMAPWYVHDMTDKEMDAFPEDANIIIQVYDEDSICDHRMAIDVFENIGTPYSRKAYYNVEKGFFSAEHSVPSDRRVNELDRLAILTPLDALIDFTFEINDPNDGYDYALKGKGVHFQHEVTKYPEVIANESKYQWRWSSNLNPRYDE
ncbi:MAG: hypothetical protein SWO11_21775 [Thermodesulfobacteriota bacterium]|nr:hypothetical protein [Thermodesulfobacteriota bacterium]